MPYKNPEKQKENSKNRYNKLKDNQAYKEKHRQYASKHYLKYKEKYRIKYQNNKEEVKHRSWKNRLKRQFNLSVEDYYILCEEQNNVCLICGKKDKNGRKLSVDHCHKSNKIRGLLCRTCNYNLGWYERCQEKIESYLKNS